MRSFFKENWFKIGLLILAIIAILFFALSWLSSKERKESLTNNIRCQQEGTQLLERMKRELSSKQAYYYGKSKFRFVSELNACLFKGSLTFENNNGSIYTRFIRDVYTNVDLARYDTLVNDDGQGADIGEVEEYNLLEIKYFTE